jgi:predicted nucleic acid-binding Zn ribbon protein
VLEVEKKVQELLLQFMDILVDKEFSIILWAFREVQPSKKIQLGQAIFLHSQPNTHKNKVFVVVNLSTTRAVHLDRMSSAVDLNIANAAFSVLTH